MTTTTRPGSARIPTATYRLQFNADFTFAAARDLVDYLARLGISDCYASPYLKAVPGSRHGYDVVDPTQLNPEIGSEEEYAAWVDALGRHGMSHVLDVVPNHMGIAGSANAWWLDVLENGPSSRYARFFDIEWNPVKDELADKVLIPILGDHYGAALERQELALTFRDGAFGVVYYENWLPVAPDTYPMILNTGLDEWIAQHEVPAVELDEFRSIVMAAENLPPRLTRDPEQIAVRAREKEVVKRRLAALADQSTELRAFIAAATDRFNGTPGVPRSFDRLDALLAEQSYRVAYWRVASEEINYRRFFDVNQLAAVRMEDPEVFEEAHRFLFELVARRAATGFRIDHVDGLYDPYDYLRRLQAKAAEVLQAGGTPDDQPFYVVVEKILGPGEHVPPEWPVHGTTGYVFAAAVNNLFVDTRNERAFDLLYARFLHVTRESLSFERLAYRSRKQVMHETMSSDLNWLGRQLNRFSERNRHFRDFTLFSLIATLKELIACFPVYRTYIRDDDPVSERDRRYIAEAVRCAKERAPGIPPLVFDFVRRVLLKEATPPTEESAEERALFIGKFQQVTSPVAAKGIEDTALYVYTRLLSLNEVGAEATQFGLSPDAVHDFMRERARRSPAALSATATHDTKRGEDLRARLNVLSEMPNAWKDAIARWRTLNRRHKQEVDGSAAPDPNEEYLIYQTLVGMWPHDPAAEPSVAPRLKEYLTKALREAKVNTSWLSPREEYEQAVHRFVDAILDPRKAFLEAFLPFQARVAEFGIYNSLAQLLLKITAPGVPDFYQGTELWQLALVDPDNRRPVDYDVRRRLLEEVGGGAGAELAARAEALLESRRDGRVKLFVTVRALHARASMREVFDSSDYLPLASSGDRAQHLFAFARRSGAHVAVTCVPRLAATLLGDQQGPPIGRTVWQDVRLSAPDGVATFRNVFTGERVEVCDGALEAASVFKRFPVALLVGERRRTS